MKRESLERLQSFAHGRKAKRKVLLPQELYSCGNAISKRRSPTVPKVTRAKATMFAGDVDSDDSGSMCGQLGSDKSVEPMDDVTLDEKKRTSCVMCHDALTFGGSDMCLTCNETFMETLAGQESQ